MRSLGRALASSGTIAALIGVVALEAVVLSWWQRSTGRGPAPQELLTFLGAGASLMLAMLWLRKAETRPLRFAAALLAALGFHAWHLLVLAG